MKGTKHPLSTITLTVSGACARLQIGNMMYTEGSPWKADGGAAGAMLAPVAFAMLALLGAVVLLAVFLAMQVRSKGGGVHPCYSMRLRCPVS